MKKGKHANNKIKFTFTCKHAKHLKNELVVYNPLYAKVSACIGSFAIATSLFTFMTLGKYKGTLASSDTARVARYVLQLTKTDETITEILPSDTKNIEFAIRNYEGEIESPEKINEVKLKYKIKIEIIDSLSLPLSYKLYREYNQGNQEEILLTNGESEFINIDMSSSEHKYKLEVKWQNGFDQIAYQNLTDHIKISIISEQID